MLLKRGREIGRASIRGGVLEDVLGLEDVLEAHFEVLGLEASSPQKLPCPRLEDSAIFCTAEILLENAKNLAQNLRSLFLFFATEDCLKKLFYYYH